MSTSIKQSKWNIPITRGNVVARESICSRLEDSLSRGCAATLLSAPPGYGKSMAVSWWLRKQDLPFAWLTLDDSDNDPVRFHTDVAAALHLAAPSLGGDVEMPRLSLFSGAGWEESVLLTEIRKLDHRVILVLDDLHTIRSPEVIGILRTIIDSRPDHLHLMLLTREDPPLPIARWRVKSEITEVRESALRFGADEEKHLLRCMGVELPADEAVILHSRTEGWAAGLYLAGLAMQDMDPQQRHRFVTDFQGTQKYIIDYLVEEALAGISEDLRLFLCQTAIADRFNSALCDELTGRHDSAGLLMQLEKRNYFIFPLDESRQWYRYHSLFGDILRSELAAGQKAALHQKAARWLEENGYLEDAIRQAAAGGDASHCAALLSRAAPQLIRDGELNILLTRLEELPESLRLGDAALVISHAWCLMLTGRPREAAALVNRLSPDQLAGMPADSISMLDVLLLFLQISYNAGISTALRQTVGQLLESKEELKAYALHGAAQRLLIEGRIDEARQKFIGAYRLARFDSQHYIALLSAKDAAMNLLVLGKKRECDRLCQQVQDRYGSHYGESSPLAAMMNLPLAASNLAGNDLADAFRLVEEALPVYRRTSMVYLVIQAELQLSLIQHAMGHTDEALRTIADVQDSLTELDFPQAIGFMKAVEAELLLASGRTIQAARWAKLMAQEAEGGINHVNERSFVIYARFLIACGKAQEAWALLSRLEASMADGGRSYRLITVCLLQSILHHRQGEADMAAERMAKALSLAADEGLYRLFLDEGPEVLEILRGRSTAYPAYTDRLFKFSGQEHAEKTPILPAGGIQKLSRSKPLPEPLSDREIDVLRLAAGGCSNQDIARKLYITLGTVKWHMNNIFSKTGATRRTQAIAMARELNLI